MALAGCFTRIAAIGQWMSRLTMRVNLPAGG